MQAATRGVATIAVCVVGLSIALVGAASAGPTATAQNLGASHGEPNQSLDGPRPGAVVQSAVDPDVVVMRVEIAPDGSADWSVALRTRLDDENTTAAFESLQADVEANASAFTDRFGTGMGRTVRSAENRTGRDMALENLTVTATRRQFGREYGVLTYRFTWTGFAAVDGERIRAGDALSGLFLDSETSLVLAYPDGYAVESVRPRPDENRTGAVVWRGQIDFGPDRPRLVVAPGDGDGVDATVVAAAAVGLLALVAGGWVLVSRTGGSGFDTTGGTGDAATDAGADGDDVTTEPVAGTGDEPPAELLSNEERVLRLLEDSGGRIKQQEIASTLDWTDAKTSQVVGSLREDDAVETFRIGRENVVTLPDATDL